MRKFRFVKPYSNVGIGGKSNFKEAQGRAGVYLIKQDDEIVYIGQSGTDLYKTMNRHFQQWNDTKAARVTYYNLLDRYVFKVRIVYCTALQAARLEKALIIKYRPRDNKEKYQDYEFDYKIYEQYDEMPVERESPF